MVYFSHPPFPEFDGKGFTRLSKQINNYLQIPIIDNMKDYLFADSLFYDTKYHLTGTGRQMRTQVLIESLRNHKQANKALIALAKKNQEHK